MYVLRKLSRSCISCSTSLTRQYVDSTRIIMGDLNPVFEETAVLLVSSDEVKAKEELSIQLWDNDKCVHIY